MTLLAEEDERFLGLLLRDEDADEELRVLLRVRMLLLACCEAPAAGPPPPPCDATSCLCVTLAAAAALAETDLVLCSTLLGSSRSESDMGVSLLLPLLELRLLWCRILRLLLVASAEAAAIASLLSRVEPPATAAASVFLSSRWDRASFW